MATTTTGVTPLMRSLAWAAFAVTVPSALWRVLMITGLMPGTSELRTFELDGNPTLGYGYVFALSIVQLATGFLAVGLMRGWGERAFGHTVPVWLPVVLGTLGGLAVTYLFDIAMVSALLAGKRPDAGLVDGGPLALMVTCYVPILLWGPLVLVNVALYWRRRTRTRRPLSTQVPYGEASTRPA